MSQNVLLSASAPRASSSVPLSTRRRKRSKKRRALVELDPLHEAPKPHRPQVTAVGVGFKHGRHAFRRVAMVDVEIAHRQIGESFLA